MDPKFKIGTGCIVVSEGKILLGKRKNSHGDGTWAPPGGHLHLGETALACAARELREETGLLAKNLSESCFVEIIVESGHYLSLFVIVEAFEGTLQLMEPEKCEGWDWFAFDQLPSPLFPAFEKWLLKMQEPPKEFTFLRSSLFSSDPVQ